MPFAIAYTYRLSLSFAPIAADGDVSSLILEKPYGRAAPYLMGLICAYVFCTKRWDRPSAIVTFRRHVHVVGWIFAAACAFLCVYTMSGTGGSLLYGIGGRFTQAAWLATARVLWGAGLFWLTIVCITRQGGLINAFLSAPAWLPTSRLTYCAYLVHPLILSTAFGSLQVPLHYSSIEAVYFCIGNVVLSYAAAAAMYLAVEAPLAAVERRFLGGL